ncbi:MAG: amidohydrolase [Steroidobacteraceae bacterium]|jgi:amidohydrolase|nr:amidohydrolase [Steroidobacteraceae bacterium]
MTLPDRAPRRRETPAVSWPLLALAALAFTADAAGAENTADKALDGALATALSRVEPKVLAWRRDIHQHPELSNREFRTAKLVADHLRRLGLAVETGVARTGVVAIIEGGRPGPRIALRADMDALPITEELDLPFRSRATATYRGETVGVMHACGHDAHTAILMGVAEALVAVRAQLPGSVVLLFQPAEEGAPDGEAGGAALMLEEGVFERHRPEAAFGLHVSPILRTGQAGYRAGPMFAASDSFRIVVRGRGTHGARPWGGVDPIVVAAQVVTALQTIVSRQVDITANPAVVTIGAIKGGIRNNVVPDEVEMIGTVRTFDAAQRADILARIRRTVEGVAAASGATAVFEPEALGTPVLENDPAVTRAAVAALGRALGPANVRQVPLVTGSEDFGFFAQRVPSFYFYLGVTPPTTNLAQVAMNHTARFYLDEAGLALGARALAAVALDYLRRGAAGTP